MHIHGAVAVMAGCVVLCAGGGDVGGGGSFYDEQARVINGREVSIEQYPYTVDYSGCAGSIIGERWILSAAHCFDRSLRRRVRVGSARARRGTPVEVERGVPHPQFKPRGFWGRFDFLLLELRDSLVFNSSVRAVPLYSDSESVPSEATAHVAAFGRTAYNSSRSRVLLEAEVAVRSAQECGQRVRHFDPEVMICALGRGSSTGGSAGVVAGSNVCKGDSGGGLTVGGRLAGVVSWGEDECPAEGPAVYARVAAVRHWIRSVSGI